MDPLEFQFHEIDRIISKNHNFTLLTHKHPDGDALGSSLALYYYLRSIGKNTTLVSSTKIPECLRFLPGSDTVRHTLVPGTFDVIIACDIAAPHLTGFDKTFPDLLSGSYTVINIDHHYSVDPFGTLKVIQHQAEATASICFDLFQFHDWKITPTIATCLLTGLITDTGSFMHSNTSAHSLRIASKLLALGADLQTITRNIFYSKKISTLKLWGRVFNNLNVDEEKGVIVSAVSEQDFIECDADSSELTGVIDYLNSVHHAKFCILLSEQDSLVKGSLRTMHEDVDVASIASHLGGGGHKKAAGFAIDGHLQKYTGWKVVTE